MKTAADIAEDVSCHNVSRFLNRKRYRYRQARTNDLLTETDKTKVK